MLKIIHKGKLIGIKIRVSKPGSFFVTADKLPLQIATIFAKTGRSVAVHYHKTVSRNTKTLGECIVVFEGRAMVRLYDSNKKFLRSVIIKAKEGFAIFSGSHAVSFDRGTKALEFKNGPFVNDKISIT